MKEEVIIRVVPQRTIFKNRISLIAEENGEGEILKGKCILQVTPKTLSKMSRPLSCRINKNGKITVI